MELHAPPRHPNLIYKECTMFEKKNLYQRYKKADPSTLVDEVTNEVYAKENVTVFISPYRKKLKEKFMLALEDGYEKLVTASESGLVYRVFHCLQITMDYDNCVLLTQEEIAEKVGSSRRVISRTLLRLQELDWIEIHTCSGQRNFYIVSPYISLKGNDPTRRRVRKAWDSSRRR